MTTLVASTTETTSPACEVLTFDVGAERYAIALEDVQEIRGYEAPTRLPGTAPYAMGVIHVRGDAIPLLDMRVLTGCARAEVTATTSVIVIRANDRVAGLLVDSVCDVVALAAGQLRQAPRLGDETLSRTILGLANVGEHLVIAINARPYLELASAAL